MRDDDDGFVLVTAKNRKAARKSNNKKTKKNFRAKIKDAQQPEGETLTAEETNTKTLQLSQKLQEDSINLSDIDKVLSGSDPVHEIICLGLGNFSDCPHSRRQLALLTRLQTLCASVTAYDPAFTGFERQFLRHLGISVLSVNKEGRIKASEGRTVFYLPHCPKQLTDNVLRANWNRDALSRVVLIGNSFSAIVERTPDRLVNCVANPIQ